MNPVDSKIEKLFDAFLDGNEDAFFEILELERPTLYDFVFRMTGQSDPSMQILDEVSNALVSQASRFSNLQELKVCLFATARSFSADLWNAETKSLQNMGFEAMEAARDENIGDLDIFFLRSLDRAMAGLPGWEREPVLLRFRYGFLPAEAAEIMTISEVSVQTSLDSALKKLCASLKVSNAEIQKSVRDIPNHALKLRSFQATVALSQIISDVETAHKGITSWGKIIFLFFLILLAVGLIFFYLRR